MSAVLERPVPLSAAEKKEAARRELAERVLAKRKFMPFVKRMNPRYKAGWVHADIAERLERFSEAVARGESPRLMILMPPRHGKSELASRMFPAWHLGNYPEHEFIATSYSLPLALTFSRKVQETLDDPAYQSVFETRLHPNSRAAEAWNLAGQPGGYMAAGIGGGITGRGAHVLVIDDPIKNAEEADSPEHREKIWEWYLSTAYSRLAPGGGVLVIQTWWHDDDLAGKLQQLMTEARKEAEDEGTEIDPDVDMFEIVKYPAIATDDEYLDEETHEIVNICPARGRLLRRRGEALHPQRYDLRKLNRIRRQNRKYDGTDGRWWSALYQQNPVPDDGDFFTKEMFRVGPPPHISRCYVYQAWDFAISSKKTNDWTVGVTGYVDEDDVLWVVEIVRFKTNDTFKIVTEILDMAERHNHPSTTLGFEDGQIWKTMRAVLEKEMATRAKRKNTRYWPTQELKPLTDKAVRARPLQGRMNAGKVMFARNTPWYDAARAELLRFPAGVHDDQVDALAWLAQLVHTRGAPQKNQQGGKPPRKSWRTRLAESEVGETSHMAS